MEVKDHHNFSINGGLCVHNCYDSLGYGLISHHASKSIFREEEQKSRQQLHKEKMLGRGRGRMRRRR